MTTTELEAVRRAITLLCSLSGEPMDYAPLLRHSPVRRFVQDYLAPDPVADLTCAEAWQFFQEIAQAGELQPVRKAVFFRQLPIVMQAVFNVRKSHHIVRSGRRQRGFRGVGIKLDADSPPLPEQPHP